MMERWNDGMENEWKSEHTKLQLTYVTGVAQSRLNYLVVSPGLFAHCRSFMSKYRKSGNLRLKFFVVAQGYEKKSHKIFSTANN